MGGFELYTFYGSKRLFTTIYSFKQRIVYLYTLSTLLLK